MRRDKRKNQRWGSQRRRAWYKAAARMWRIQHNPYLRYIYQQATGECFAFKMFPPEEIGKHEQQKPGLVY